MQNLRTSIAILFLLLIISFSYANPSCGDTITEDTTLTADMIDCTGDGLVIGAENITIDCAGFGIYSDATTAAYKEAGIETGSYDFFTIKNCEIKGFYYGIYSVGGSDANISDNNIIYSIENGLKLEYAHRTVVKDNNISNNLGSSIWSGSDDLNILSNTITNNSGYGIYFQPHSNRVLVFDNNISNNIGNGIHSATTDLNNLNILSNTITNNTINGIDIHYFNQGVIFDNNISNNGGYGINLDSSADLNVLNNTITNNTSDGIHFRICDRALIFGNNISNNSGQGSYLYSSDDLNISSNTITNNTSYGISASSCVRALIFDNNASNNGDYGIYPNLSDDVNILSNTITNNSDYGIYFRSSNRGVIYDNTITNNAGGLRFLYHSNQGLIFDNNISNNSALGLYFSSSIDCNFSNNIIKNNASTGLFVYDSCYDNNFYNNIIEDNDAGDKGVYLANDAPYSNYFFDNTVSGHTYDFYLDNTDTAFLVNTTFTTVGFEETNGTFYVGWWLDVNVVDDSTGVVLEDATVTITDQHEQEKYSGLTNANGVIPQQYVFDYNRDPDGQNSYSPYDINVTLTGYDTNGITVTVDENKELTIRLVEEFSLRGTTITEDTTLTEDITKCSGDGLIIGADNITLDCNGFGIYSDATQAILADYGINIKSYNFVTIKNCDINGFYNGIASSGGTDSNISDNNITYSINTGINLDDSDRTVIKNNNILRNGNQGINVYSAPDVNISNNTITNNTDDGIYFSISNHALVFDNNISNNGDYGIDISLSDDLNVLKNTITNNTDDGIHSISCDRTLIFDNNISTNRDYGIGTNFSDDMNILSNTITNNSDDGINFNSCDHTLVFDNNTSANEDYGIYADSSEDMNVLSNTITNNSNDGLYFNSSNQGLIFDNNISNNSSEGVYLYSSIDYNFSNNIIKNNASYGIELCESCYDNNFYNNTIEDNDAGIYGVYFTKFTGLAPHSNYFFDNTISGHSSAFFLSDDANVFLVGTTSTTAGFAGVDGNIYVGWWLDVNVVDDSTGVVLEGATVTITDQHKQEKYSGLTNANGVIARQYVFDYNQNSAGKNYYSPYDVNVTLTGYDTNGMTVTVDENKALNINISQTVVPSNITQSGTGNTPRPCESNRNGSECSENETCSGQWTTANNTSRCCLGNCIAKEDGLGEKTLNKEFVWLIKTETVPFASEQLPIQKMVKGKIVEPDLRVATEKDFGITRILKSSKVTNNSNKIVFYDHRIELVVKNVSGKKLEQVELLETIPKELVENADLIKIDSNYEIIEKDPVIKFIFGNFEAGEEKSVYYDFNSSEIAEFTESFESMENPGITIKIAPEDSCFEIICNDANPCTFDYCVNGNCEFDNKENGTACNNNMECQQGKCIKKQLPLEKNETKEQEKPFDLIPIIAITLILVILGTIIIGIGYYYFLQRKKSPLEKMGN